MGNLLEFRNTETLYRHSLCELLLKIRIICLSVGSTFTAYGYHGLDFDEPLTSCHAKGRNS